MVRGAFQYTLTEPVEVDTFKRQFHHSRGDAMGFFHSGVMLEVPGLTEVSCFAACDEMDSSEDFNYETGKMEEFSERLMGPVD